MRLTTLCRYKSGTCQVHSQSFQSVTDEDSAAANIYLSHYMPEGRANFTAANAAEIARMMGDVRYTGPVHMGVEVLKASAEKPLYYYMYR